MEPVARPDDDEQIVREMIGRWGAPAFMRRARRVEDSYQRLVDGLVKQRLELLAMVGLRLGQLLALAGDWTLLAEWVCPSDLVALQELYLELQPRLRMPLTPTSSSRALRAALVELRESLEYFNARWQAILAGLDLAPLNAEREAYNRYYLLEKECALGSARIARAGFRPMPLLDRSVLSSMFPCLTVPRI